MAKIEGKTSWVVGLNLDVSGTREGLAFAERATHPAKE